MAILDEVPGALERPGGCRIILSQTADGETVIAIPPRRASPLIVIPALVLLANLLLTLVTGAMLFFGHRSILFMTQIAPRDLPRSMHPYEFWYIIGWLFLETVGFWSLAVIVRPLFTREVVSVGPQMVTHQREAFGRSQRRQWPRSEISGFYLKRDPQQMMPSVLTLQARGEEIALAEHAGESDREWLTSVGNALLRAF